MTDKPSVLFVCVHNAGRSQMAAGFLSHLAGDAIEVRSAGSAPAETINSAAVEAMAELGIDISAQTPKILTTDAVQDSDVVITMGCGDTCPDLPRQELPRLGPRRSRRPRHRRGSPDPRRDQNPRPSLDQRTHRPVGIALTARTARIRSRERDTMTIPSASMTSSLSVPDRPATPLVSTHRAR